MIIVCKNSLDKLFLLSPKKMLFKIFGFSIFNIKNRCILMFVSSYRVAASLITSKFLEYNTENEEFEKSRVLLKCLLTHITLIITTTIIIVKLCPLLSHWTFFNLLVGIIFNMLSNSSWVKKVILFTFLIYWKKKFFLADCKIVFSVKSQQQAEIWFHYLIF